VNRRWLLAALALLVPLPAAAQEKPLLRWGTDPTGGAPYVFKDDANNFVGFEVELAEYLARERGRTGKMVGGDWDKLPEVLGKPVTEDGIDVVLNGYELREDLEKKYPSTIPYYVYRLALVTHAESAEVIESWADLKRGMPD